MPRSVEELIDEGRQTADPQAWFNGLSQEDRRTVMIRYVMCSERDITHAIPTPPKPTYWRTGAMHYRG